MRRNLRARSVAWAVVLFLTLAGALTTAARTPQEKTTSGSISGVVMKDGEPAAGVGVLITEATQGPPVPGRTVERTLTDKEGRFSISGLARASYHVDAYLPGSFVRSESPWRGPLLVTVGDGEVVDGLKIELEPGGVITGKIVDAEGKLVAGEAVKVYIERQGDVGATSIVQISADTESDDRGIYRVYGLSPGRYAVATGDEKSGFGVGLYGLSFHGGGNKPEDAKRITVESGTEVRDVDLIVRRGEESFTIVGKVVDAQTRKPVTSVRMFCGPLMSGQMTGFSGGGGVSDDGGFSIEGRISGTYSVMAMANESDDGSYFCDPVEVVVSGRDVTGVVVEMQRGASIRGVVVPLETERGLDISTIQGNAISLQRASVAAETRIPFSRSGQLLIKPDMTFRSTGLRNGEYSVAFHPYSPVKGFYVARVEIGGVPLAGAIPISEPVEIAGVRIVVGRAGALLRGRVVLRNGTYPFQQIGIRLKLAGSNQHVGFLRVDSKGTFQMESVPPGEYEASAIATSYGEGSVESKPVALSIGVDGTVNVTIELDLKPEPPSREGEP